MKKKHDAQVKVTARQVNGAANELSERGGYSNLAKHYWKVARDAAKENKGIVWLEPDDVILGVIRSREK